jgi:hypothetical protein
MFDKMNKNDIIYYLGLVVTVCLFVYIVMKCMTLQMNIIEGAVGGRSTTTDNTDDSSADDTTKKSSSVSDWFSKESKKTPSINTTSNGTDKTNISSAVKSNTNTIEDMLLVSKYRDSYEKTIINLESNVSFALLSAVVNNAESISKNPTSTDSQTMISNINNLKTFRSTLNDAMKVLDSK